MVCWPFVYTYLMRFRIYSSISLIFFGDEHVTENINLWKLSEIANSLCVLLPTIATRERAFFTILKGWKGVSAGEVWTCKRWDMFS